MQDKNLLLEMLTAKDAPTQILAQKPKETLTQSLTKTFFNSLIIFCGFSMIAGTISIIRTGQKLPVILLGLFTLIISGVNAIEGIKDAKEDAKKGLL